MTKRVFIVHGWGGFPKEGWFPWLQHELKKENFVVEIPEMPETDEPKIEAWISHLADVVGEVDELTYGHHI
jgi:predicted alpha/beta hydrolase family esterase